MKPIFDFESYKPYIFEYLRSRPLGGHGEKSKIANALGCQLAYLSQVLNGDAQLSLEQAEKLGTYLNLSDSEMDHLFLLVEIGRAGSVPLKRRLETRRKKILQERENLKHRLEVKETLSFEAQVKYYSSWIFALVHQMVSIPDFQTTEKIATTLNIRAQNLAEVLDFLSQQGLIQNIGRKWKAGNVNLHLANDSPLIRQHHTNWRLRAIQSMQTEREEDLHYSSVVSVAEADIPEVRKILLSAIEQVRKVVKKSAPEDAVYSYGIDLFRLAKN